MLHFYKTQVPLNYKMLYVPVESNFNQAIKLSKRPHDAVGGMEILLHYMPNMLNLNLIMKKQSGRLQLWNILQEK